MGSEMKPTETVNARGERIYHHPAFGQIRASRVSGKTHLYGTDFLHQYYIVIELQRSEENWHLSQPWHHPSGGSMFSVAMSEAQWATFVSSLNVGSGVPCTIEHARTGPIEEMPRITPAAPRAEEFKRDMRETLSEAVTELTTALKAARDRKVHSSIIAGLEAALRAVKGSTEFVEHRFAEHIEDLVEEAKVEANAYIDHAVKVAGVEAIRERNLLEKK